MLNLFPYPFSSLYSLSLTTRLLPLSLLQVSHPGYLPDDIRSVSEGHQRPLLPLLPRLLLRVLAYDNLRSGILRIHGYPNLHQGELGDSFSAV